MLFFFILLFDVILPQRKKIKLKKSNEKVFSEEVSKLNDSKINKKQGDQNTIVFSRKRNLDSSLVTLYPTISSIDGWCNKLIGLTFLQEFSSSF